SRRERNTDDTRKETAMKKTVQIIISILILAIGTVAYAAPPSWKPLPTASATSSANAITSEVVANGYIGAVKGGGIDVDGDGTIDVTINEESLIHADVPLNISLVAGKGAESEKFIAPTISIKNKNTKNTIKVSMVGFAPQGDVGGIVLANKETGLTQDDLALKVLGIAGAENPFGSASGYAANCGTTPIIMGNIPAQKAGWFTFGATYIDAFNTAHAGSKIANYKAVFRFDIQ
ncbi:MAG: hypothetical protein RR777_06570, partial [Christensenellaceae bacterium]